MLVDGESFVIGDAGGKFYLVTADAERSLKRTDQMDYDKALVSPLIPAGGKAIGVCRGNVDELVLISADGKLAVEKMAELPGGYVAGPIPVGDDRFLLILDTEQTVCFDGQLNQVWQMRAAEDNQIGDKLAGLPITIDGQVWMAFESGRIMSIDMNNGEVTSQLEVNQSISGPPLAYGDSWWVPGSDGTLHRLESLSSQ